MRRKTLGEVTPSRANARASLGPSRVASKDGAASVRRERGAAPLDARPSFNSSTNPNSSATPARAARPSSAHEPASAARTRPGSALSRRSSIYSRGPVARADPRPTSDKAYTQQGIRTLIAYLSSHGYDAPISPKLLAAPTSKDFMHIVSFLFRRLDPNIKFVGKMEDEVPQVFKRLQYPFQISKSALYAVGSPHTWPGLLAALVWLVELLVYEERAEEARAAGSGGEDATDPGPRQFFEYVSKAYGAFLAGDDDTCAALEEELGETFRQRDAAAADEIARLEKANAALKAEIEAADTEPTPLARAQEKRANMEGDVAKFQKLISNLQTHKAQLAKKCGERMAEAEAKAAELKEALAVVDNLRARVANQAVSQDDVKRMQRDRARINDELRGAVASHEDAERQADANAAAVAAKSEELEAIASEYTSKGEALQVLPAGAKRANGVDFTLVMNPNGADVCATDLEGSVRPALADVVEEYAQRTREDRRELLDLQEQQHKTTESLAEAREANAQARSELMALEERYTLEKERADADFAQQTSAAASVEEELREEQTRSAREAAEAEARLASAMAEHERATTTCEEEREKLNSQLLNALDALMSHKAYLQDTLQKVVEMAVSTADEAIAAGEPEAATPVLSGVASTPRLGL